MPPIFTVDAGHNEMTLMDIIRWMTYSRVCRSDSSQLDSAPGSEIQNKTVNVESLA